MRMIFKGFRFGMILQLAIGPMCIFIFQTSIKYGFLQAEQGVIGTAIVDSLEILLAILGVGMILEKSKKAEFTLKIFGVMILVLYGLNSILSAFDISLFGTTQQAVTYDAGNTLIQAIILTLSDPLSIVFWAGIFSAKITEERFDRKSLRLFAAGCVTATLFFLTFIAGVGSLTGQVIPESLIRLLNFAVGIFMFYFAYRNVRSQEAVAAKKE